MSGGHFNYDQYRIRTIAETIRSIIDNNTKKNEWGYASNYNEETLKHFERAIEILKLAEIYTQRIDWLVSGDDGEETFIGRLKEELAEIKAIPIEPPVKPEIANIEIIDWHKRKFATADHWDVYRKLLEEVGELGEAIARKIYGNIELEFGDVEICLIVLANKLRVNKNSAVAKSHAKNLEKVTLKK